MPNRSKRDIVDRIKLLEEEVYPDGTNTPEEATAGESGGLESVSTEYSQVTGAESMTVDVPSDAPTLQEAVILAAQNLPNGEISVYVNIESGFTVENQISLSNGSFGHMVITSEDDVVPCDVSGNLSTFNGVRAPVIDTLFDMEKSGRYGLEYRDGSVGLINSGCGVINAGDRGLTVADSRVSALQTTFTGAVERNAHVTTSSNAYLQGADLSNTDNSDCLFVSRGATVHALGADCSGAGRYGAQARRSWLVIEDSDCSDAGADGIEAARGSWVSATGATVENCGQNGIRVSRGSHVSAQDATITNNNIQVEGWSTCILVNATLNGSDIDIYQDGGIVNAYGANISNAYRPIVTRGGSMVNVDSATIDDVDTAIYSTNPGGDQIFANGVEISNADSYPVFLVGSQVFMNNAEIVNSSTELLVSGGTIVHAKGTTVDGSDLTAADTTLSALNSVEDDGLVWG